MNKTDCEKIGFILSTSKCSEELQERLLALDPRIEGEFTAFEEVQGRSDAVDALVEQKMIARFGHRYGLLKIVTKDVWREITEEARREIYGDDYHPSLFI